MKYKKIFNKNKSLFPDVVHRIKQIPDKYIYGHLHKKPIRHPGGIFNRAFDEVIIAIQTVFDDLNTVKNDNKNKDKWEKLLRSQKHLINEICSFYDECYIILITLCLPSDSNPIFAEDWLKKNGYTHGSYFKSSVDHLIKKYKDINNRLKHNNQRLLSIHAENINYQIYGFFIEGLVDGKTVGPDPEIHKIFNGVYTCFSFEHFLINLFLTSHIISDKLQKSIEKHLKDQHGFKFNKKKYIKHNENLEKLWSIFDSYSYIFFPHEYLEKYPKIKIVNNEYDISFPHGDKKYHKWSFTINCVLEGDGYSKSFTLPYLRIIRKK